MRACRVRRTICGVIVFLALGAGGAQTSEQSFPRIGSGDAAIGGRVVDRGSGRAVAGAIVVLTVSDASPMIAAVFRDPGGLVTETDAGGHYRFDGIATGAYRVAATHPAYVPQFHGAPGVRVLVRVEARQIRADVNFSLTRGGTIAGRVLTHEGQPVSRAMVTAEPAIERAGDPERVTAATGPNGEYVIGGLPEGAYRVAARWFDPSAADAGPGAMTRVFYPGKTRLGDTALVRVVAGEAATGIDITVPPHELLGVTGHVTRGSEGGRIDALLLWGGSSLRTIKVSDEGAFEVTHLTPGRYTLAARVRGDARDDAAAATFDLFGDMGGLALTLLPTGAIAGRVITYDGRPLPGDVEIAAVLAADGRPIDPLTRDRASVASDGSFEVTRVFGERVLHLARPDSEWTIDRVLRGSAPVESVTVASREEIRDLVVVIAPK
jgi:hypothetical protein